MKKNITLSIVILNYNTKEVLHGCLSSLREIKDRVVREIIVVDNASSDGSVQMVKSDFLEVFLIQNPHNFGFAKGNNSARARVKGKYILFLNSDTIVPSGTLDGTIAFIEKNKELGAVTCKVVLPSGELDPDTRRSFPTPWVAFTHFSYLDRIFSTSPLFSKYWYGYLKKNEAHEIDSLQGAFLLIRKKVMDEVSWFDESYFLDGEDIDLCWRIKKMGWKIFYYPKYSITHIKKVSKKKVKLKRVLYGISAMEIFYKKRMWNQYPFYINYLVLLGINIIKLTRITKSFLGI